MKARGNILGTCFGAGLLAIFTFSAIAEELPTIDAAFASVTTHITAMPNAVAVPVDWTFTNYWDFPLVVEKFDQSCGCLSGKMNPQTDSAVAPGESGTIRAAFTPGAHRGLVRKSLHVRFVGHDSPVELVVEAQVPYSIELSAREITWESDAPSAPQVIDITTGTGVDFTITGLSGVTDSQFLISQETIEPSRHYRLAITPADGVAPGIHTLLVRTDSPDPRDRVTSIFLHTP